MVGPYVTVPKGILPASNGKLSEKSVEFFRYLSSVAREQPLRLSDDNFTSVDIERAAREALILNQSLQTRDGKADKLLKAYPRAYDKWCPEEEQRVAELYRAGKTMREIAVVVKRHPNSIKNRLERMGMFDPS